jgi:hypothetical protein
VRRRDDVALLERPADPDGDRLFADRDVQEAGQLARTKPFLDLLLETADQEHLAEELAQVRLRQRPFLLNLRHEPEFMLRPLALVDRFNEIERDLPADWSEATLALTAADAERVERAAALLGPTNPGRLGSRIRFTTARRGSGTAPDAVRRLLRRLDQDGIDGELELVAAREAPAGELRPRRSLHDGWQRALAALPSDWSDVYAEVRLDSTDYVEPAALLLSPLNPARYGGAATLRFRCAHHFGYGVSPEMAARCFMRCDDAGITGDVEILRALSDTYPVATQGPVWLVEGRAV